MLEKSSLVSVRDYIEGDKSFVYATWLRGLRYGNDWFEEIDSDAYFKVYHAVIDSILAKPSVDVKVACLKDDPDTILGYSVVDSAQVLHWVFCKKAWRGIGVAKSLVPSTITTVTHLTKASLAIVHKHPEVKFNPFII